MNGDLGDIIGGLAEAFGLGEMVKGALGGAAEPYGEGRSTETSDTFAQAPYVYERVLTRKRESNVNDR